MYSLRQVLRIGTRVVFSKKPTNLHRLSLINEEQSSVNFYERTFIRLNTNLCEPIQENNTESSNKRVLGKIEGKLKVMFTCKICKFRSGKVISKLAYEKGVVIIQCESCKNNHLIADNLGWFEELKHRNNIEKILAAKGETVRKIQNDIDGYIEVVEKAELNLLQHNVERNRNLTEEQNETDNDKKGTEISGEK